MVSLIKGGTITGSNLKNATAWSNTLTPVTYGGPGILWGATWLPSDINATNFGVALSVSSSSNGFTTTTSTVDYIQVTVYYTNVATATVTQTGTTGGTYTASPAGLSINSVTLSGAVILGTSTPGAYSVTYTIAASAGCAVVTATAPITINQQPVATFSYTGTPYCSNGITNPSPTFSGGGVPGIFSSTASYCVREHLYYGR